MKYVFVLIVIANGLFAQKKLKSGFDANEFLDVLHLEWSHQDSGKYAPPVGSLPKNYKRIYRSPEVGLKNRFDFWLRDDSVGVFCLRYTVGGGSQSWLENFYSGMINSSGTLKLNDSTTFNYKFSNDDKALVHHGWTIGVAHLAPLLTEKIREYSKLGVKEFIIVGHSQGAALAFLMRSYLEYAPETIVPKGITYKVYSCAAPKPGNLFYAYDYDFITRNGWGFRIINTSDWVPQTPFTIQTIGDLHPINPFAKRKELMRRRVKKPLVRLFVNRAIGDMEHAAVKTNKKYKKHLTKQLTPFVKKNLPQYKTANVENSNFYNTAGTPIILQPDANYDVLFKFDGVNIFYNHMFEPYIYLTKLYYLNK